MLAAARWTMEEEDLEPFIKAEDEDEDPIPLRITSKSKRRLRANETAATGSIGSATWKTRLVLLTIAGLVVLLLIVGSFVGGIFLGKKIVHDHASGSSSCGKCNNAGGTQPVLTPSSGNGSAYAGGTQPGSAYDMVYNWGATVNVSGQPMRVVDWLNTNMTAENMMNNLKNLTEKPHIAGSEENKQLAEMIYKQWRSYGMFDEVELVNYSVYLSYPNPDKGNVLQLLGPTGDVVYEADTSMEPPLTPGENDSTVVPPFNAYSGDGNATGLLVYVNYGTINDFLYLTENLSLSLNGRICIARYGHIYRGDKAKLAQYYGCSGLIIYSDPAEFAPKGGLPVYPNGPNLPPGGVQRGSLLISSGDPLTPGIPAISGVFRRNYSEVLAEKAAPTIPVQPISYADAIHFMSQLDGNEAPPSWQGQLGITYYITQQETNQSNATYIEVNNYQTEKFIYDVTATIYGGVEPDRAVILGNHRDAWVFGAADPNSGTAALMEIARAFSVLRSYGWRPGRTIVLCSWDAEEYSLVGSTEWVEDRAKLLGASTVAYLNVDIGVSGSEFFGAAATPLLYEVLFMAANMTKSPNPRFDTVYAEWRHCNWIYNNGTKKPRISDLGSGSDFTTFLQTQGISCSNINYANYTPGGYAVYHSVHDNFYWMQHFGDPGFSRHLALGLVWAKTGILLATTPVLPYDPRDYAIALNRIYSGLVQQYGTVLQQQSISLDYLSSSVDEFTQASLALWADIQQAIATNLTMSENIVRIINNKLMNIERAFIHPTGLPGRPLFKHVVFAPSSFNAYLGSTFPGISDTIFNATHYGGEWDEVRKQIDIVRISIQYATQIMSQPALKYIKKTHM